MRKRLFGFMLVILFVVLSVQVIYMPSTSKVTSPAYNDTTKYYLEHAVSETGAQNIVAAILTDYRVFDTMIETVVLFTAIIAVVSVLKKDRSEGDEYGG